MTYKTQYQKAYEKVEALRKQHPRMRTSQLMELAKVSGQNYYRGRRQVLDHKTPLKKGEACNSETQHGSPS